MQWPDPVATSWCPHHEAKPLSPHLFHRAIHEQTPAKYYGVPFHRPEVLPPHTSCPRFSSAVSPTVHAQAPHWRCTSAGADLDPSDITQITTEQLHIAFQLILSDTDFVSDSFPNPTAQAPRLPRFVIPVVAKFSSTQGKLKQRFRHLYWRRRDLNLPDGDSSESSGSDANPWIGLS